MSTTGYRSVTARTTDLEQAEGLIRGNTGVYSVAPARTSAFSFELARGGDARGLISSFSYHAAFETENVHDAFTIASVAEGTMRWEIGDERGTQAEGPFLQAPGARMRTSGERVTAIGTALPRWFLEQVACESYAVDAVGLRFASPRPVSAARARFWLRLTSFASELRDSGALETDLLRAVVLRNLAVGVLECFEFLGEPDPRPSAAPAAQLAVYRRARTFLDEHASLPITIGDAARHAGVSTAMLTAAFVAHAPLGLTPAQYLRRTRLAAAHRDLVNGDPTRGDTVREIALRWGFPHPGTFAKHYRDAYGSNPRWVLDR